MEERLAKREHRSLAIVFGAAPNTFETRVFAFRASFVSLPPAFPTQLLATDLNLLLYHLQGSLMLYIYSLAGLNLV